MKILYLFIILFVYSNCETVEQAASYTRWMISNLDYGVIASHDLETNIPVGMLEDFCEYKIGDNSTGNPFFYLANISTSSINLNQDPFGSFTLHMPNCSKSNYDGVTFD